MKEETNYTLIIPMSITNTNHYIFNMRDKVDLNLLPHLIFKIVDDQETWNKKNVSFEFKDKNKVIEYIKILKEHGFEYSIIKSTTLDEIEQWQK